MLCLTIVYFICVTEAVNGVTANGQSEKKEEKEEVEKVGVEEEEEEIDPLDAYMNSLTKSNKPKSDHVSFYFQC